MLLMPSPAPVHAMDSWEAGLCWGREAGSTITRRDNSCQSQISVDPAAPSDQPCQTALGKVVFSVLETFYWLSETCRTCLVALQHVTALHHKKLQHPACNLWLSQVSEDS